MENPRSLQNLGWYAAHQRNYRVLLTDLDPQFNLSQYVLGTDGCEQLLKEKRLTVEALFRNTVADGRPANLKRVIWKVTDWRDGSCLHLIPSALELAWTTATASGRSHILKNYLDAVRGEYDLILVDCPPTKSVLSTAAYHAADYVFVPVKPEFLSTIGLPLLLKSMTEFGSVHGEANVPELGGIILNDTMDKLEHQKSRKAVQDLASEYNWPIFKNALSHSDSYPAGARMGKPIFMTDKAKMDEEDRIGTSRRRIPFEDRTLNKKQIQLLNDLSRLLSKYEASDLQAALRTLKTAQAKRAKKKATARQPTTRTSRHVTSKSSKKTPKKTPRNKATTGGVQAKTKRDASVEMALFNMSPRELAFTYSRLFHEKHTSESRKQMISDLGEYIRQLPAQARAEAENLLSKDDDATENYRRWLSIISRSAGEKG